MELQEVIKNRRSIRKYKNKEIDDKVILKLIESARISPSAKNIQPWQFYIAKSKIKNKIANTLKDYHHKNPEGTIGMVSTAEAIDEAPVLILVFRNSNSQLDRNDTLSLGAAIEHILLTATDLGLGSLWICATYNVRNEISKIIGTDLELYSAVAIGYSNEDPEPRPRKKLEDIILK